MGERSAWLRRSAAVYAARRVGPPARPRRGVAPTLAFESQRSILPDAAAPGWSARPSGGLHRIDGGRVTRRVKRGRHGGRRWRARAPACGSSATSRPGSFELVRVDREQRQGDRARAARPRGAAGDRAGRQAAVGDHERRRRAAASTRGDEPALVGVDHGLHAVAQAELAEQVGDVGLDRRLGDDERLGDLGVARARRRASAAPAARGRSARRARPARATPRRAGGGRPGRAAARVTAGASTASPAATARTASTTSLGRRVLEQEAAGPGAQRLDDVLVEAERGEDEHALARAAGASPRCRPCRACGCPSARRRGRAPRRPRTASSPVPASATTSIEPVASSTALKPARIIGWSSAMTTRSRLTSRRRRGARRGPRSRGRRAGRRSACRRTARRARACRPARGRRRSAARAGASPLSAIVSSSASGR